MPKLNQVVGTILRDTTISQHLANMTTARLALLYREHELLRYFPVPNAAAEEMDLELKFAIADPGLLPVPEKEAGADRDEAESPDGPPPATGVNVIVQAEYLAKLPQEAIQTLRFRIGLRGYRWGGSEGHASELIEI